MFLDFDNGSCKNARNDMHEVRSWRGITKLPDGKKRKQCSVDAMVEEIKSGGVVKGVVRWCEMLVTQSLFYQPRNYFIYYTNSFYNTPFHH